MWIASDQSIEKSHLSRVAVLGIFYLRLGNPLFCGDILTYKLKCAQTVLLPSSHASRTRWQQSNVDLAPIYNEITG